MIWTRWYVVAGCCALAAVGTVWAAGGRPTAAVSHADGLDIPHQWRWRLNRVPVIDTPSQLRVVVRQRVEPVGRLGLPSVRQTALRVWDGDDQALTGETLPAGAGLTGAIALDLIDLRQLSDAVGPDQPPLRARVVLKTEWATTRGAVKLVGHSVRGKPVVHADDWSDGELALLTLSTADMAAQHTYTFLLTSRPDYR